MPSMDIGDQKSAAIGEGASPTRYSPGTARTLFRLAVAVALALGIGFALVRHWKTASEAQLASATQQKGLEKPRVDVVTVGPPSGTQALVLPGETAAWYTGTIYARVNGYVGHWFVDIGDHVKKGQVLATIETPDLDAELGAARAQLQTSRSQ